MTNELFLRAAIMKWYLSVEKLLNILRISTVVRCGEWQETVLQEVESTTEPESQILWMANGLNYTTHIHW